jgi:hypothetical protein
LREESNAALIKNLGDEILKFQENLNFEKKIREETHNTIFKMLEDIQVKLGD